MSCIKTIKVPCDEPNYVFKQWKEGKKEKESHTLIIGNKKHIMSKSSYILFQQEFINMYEK